MRKLIIFLVTGMLWCNVGFASFIEMNKCFPTKIEEFHKDGKGTDIAIEKTFSNWEEFNNRLQLGPNNTFVGEDPLYDGPRYNNIIISLNTETGILSFMKVYHDEYLKDCVNCESFDLEKAQVYDAVGNTFFAQKLKKYPDETFELDEKATRKTIYAVNLETGRIDTTLTWLYKKGTSNKIRVGKRQWNWICESKNDSDGAAKGSISQGTAFFINNKGNLITNNHVVDGCDQSKIKYFNKEYDAQLISTDNNLDLALLKVNIEPKSFISFSKNKVKKRDEITAAGYPLGIEFSDDLKINDGKVSSLKGLDNNSNHITHNININPGNSGGPIVNQKGELVAVAVSGMSKEITEGLNFGIKSSAVENFLRSNKINPNMGSINFSINNDKVNQLLEESTVYTFCEIK